MSSESPLLVRRYAPGQRLIHWIGAGSFLTLLFSGIALLYPPLSFLAAGGLSRLIHRIAVIPFVLLPIAYAIFLPRQARDLLIESFTYTREDWQWLTCMPAYLVGRTRGLPPQGRLNAGQKLHHAATFLMFVTISVSGFVLWVVKGQLGPNGLAMAAMVHDLSMLGLSVLLIGHVYFTFLYDALPAMRTGLVSEPYARMEHLKWLEALPPDAFVVPSAVPKGAEPTEPDSSPRQDELQQGSDSGTGAPPSP